MIHYEFPDVPPPARLIPAAEEVRLLPSVIRAARLPEDPELRRGVLEKALAYWEARDVYSSHQYERLRTRGTIVLPGWEDDVTHRVAVGLALNWEDASEARGAARALRKELNKLTPSQGTLPKGEMNHEKEARF